MTADRLAAIGARLEAATPMSDRQNLKYAALMAACREMDVEHGSLGEDMGCVSCQHFMKALRDLGEDFDTFSEPGRQPR